MMVESELIQLIFNMGFPAGIATYIIVKIEKSLQQLIKAVDSLTQIVQKEISHGN